MSAVTALFIIAALYDLWNYFQKPYEEPQPPTPVVQPKED